MKTTPLRRRIYPSVPVLIEYSDENGPFSEIYQLTFNVDTQAAISEKTGLVALDFEIWDKLNASVLRAMFWGALLTNYPEFAKKGGFEAASSMLDGPNQIRVIESLWEAYLLYLPSEQADALRKAKARAEAEAGEQTRDPLPSPAPNPMAPVTVMSKPPSDGSSSGPSADTISDSPIATSAS